MEGRAIEQDKAGLGLPVLELAPRLEPELPLQDCNGRRDTPDAYGSLATVRSTAASSRACRVCRAWGTIGRRRRALPTRRRQQQCVPDHATHAIHARWPRRGSRVLTSTPQRSTPSGSGAAHVHGRRRRSARLGRPGQRLPTSSAHERAHQARASPCRHGITQLRTRQRQAMLGRQLRVLGVRIDVGSRYGVPRVAVPAIPSWVLDPSGWELAA
jgi:hypothetical protein